MKYQKKICYQTNLGHHFDALDSARSIAWGAIGAAMDCYDTALRYAKANSI
jgi:glutaryl-CoA dehydrogenase